MRLTIMDLALLVSSAAYAQETRTETVPLAGTNWTQSSTLTINAGGPFAIINADGQVFIDWERAEKVAASPEKTDAMTLAFARLILAVRDGSWKSIKE